MGILVKEKIPPYRWPDSSSKREGSALVMPKSYSTTKTEPSRDAINKAERTEESRLQEIEDRVNKETLANIQKEIKRSDSDSFWDMKVSGVQSTLDDRVNKIKETGEIRKDWERKSTGNKIKDISVELALGIIPELPILNMLNKARIANKNISYLAINRIGMNSYEKYSKFNDKWENVTDDLVRKFGNEYKDRVNTSVNIEKYRFLDGLEGAGNPPLGEKALYHWLNNNSAYDEVVINSVDDAYAKVLGANRIDLSSADIRKFDDLFMKKKNISVDELNSGPYDDEYQDFIKLEVKNKMIEGSPYGSVINLSNKNPDLYSTVSHEMKHQINGNGIYLGENYKRIIKSIFINENKIPESAKAMYKYVSKPTEFSSFIGTNLKDELVKKGLINSVHDKVTEKTIKSIEDNKILKNYLPFIKDREGFVNLINITPYGIAGVLATPLFNNNKIEQ